jgi:predicted alpha/beta-fold hydrolase
MPDTLAPALGVGRLTAPALASGRYRAPWWLPGGHAQTIWPAIGSRRPPPVMLRRERWRTPDGDFVDVDFLDAGGAADAPMLVLFHGLEGSSQSHYARSFAHAAREAGWRYAVPHFRGCSGELNLAPRAYHSGDFEEIGWILQRLRERAGQAVRAIGVSLGGNALLRWVQEAGDQAARTASAVAAVCSPVDLAAGGHAIGRGFNRLVYTRMFLRTMVPKALAKLAQHPGLFDRERLLAARDLYAFDDVFTAPLHGFAGTDDYWSRASAKPHLARIRIPALVLNARNDPFVPAASLPMASEVGRFVTLWQPAHGGHAGFPGGAFPGHLMTLPLGVLAWMRAVTG